MRLEARLLDGRVASQTHEVVLKQMESTQAAPITLAALAKDDGKGATRSVCADAARH